MTFFNRKPANKLFLHLSLLLLASVVVALPIYWFGIPNGNDLPQHYQFALTFRDALHDGTLYPSWSAASNYGFGDVGIRFYPPLSYYVLNFFQLLAGNWYDASVLTFIFWFFAGSAGVYFWARESFGANASLAAALVYVFVPYHVNQIYNAFTYAEFAASAVLPFCFLFVTRVCRRGKPADVMGLAASYALLVLTHLPLTVIGSLAIFVFALASLPKKNRLAAIARLGVGAVTGLLASAFYWVRMASELNFLNHATEEFTSKAYDFHVNFLAAIFYVAPREYDDRSLWFSDLMLLVTCALFVPSAAAFYLAKKTEVKPKLFAVAALFAFSIFMATPLSLPVWENFGVLQKVQFPWRWLAVISLAGTMFVAAGFDDLVEFFRTRMRPLALVAFGLLIAGLMFTATQIIKPALFSPRAEFTAKIDALADAESYECWRAVWSKKEAFDNREKVALDDRRAEIESWQPTEKIFHVSAGAPQTARLAVFYYPHWQATVNNQPAELQIADDGTMLVPLGSNASEIKVRFIEPARVRAAFYLSAVVWLALFLTFAAVLVKQKSAAAKISNANAPEQTIYDVNI